MIYKDAEDFCKMHNLPEEKLNLLINILKVEIQNTLTRIDEEDEEFERKVMTIAHLENCIGCQACSRICPKNCYSSAPIENLLKN